MSVTLKGKAVTWGAGGITFTAGIISSTSLHANQSFEGEWTAQNTELVDVDGRLQARYFWNRQKRIKIQCVPYGNTVALANTSARSWLPRPGSRVIAADAQGTGFKTAYDVLSSRQLRTNTDALIAELELAEAPNVTISENDIISVSGTQQLVRLPDEKEYQAGIGWVTIEVYEGTREGVEGAALALSQDIAYSRIRTFGVEGIKYRLNATVGGFDGGTGDPELVNTWELLGQVLQNDIFDHPNSRAISSANIKLALAALADPSLTRPPAFTSPTDGNASLLWNLVANNKLSYQDGYFALRHTVTATNYDDITVSMTNIGRIFSSAQIPAATAPASIVTAVNAISPWFTAPTGYSWGWLKQPPQIVQTFQGRPQVVNEWWYYAWSTFLYADAT